MPFFIQKMLMSMAYELTIIKCIDKKEKMRVIEYINDLSVTPSSAVTSYFSHKMIIH